MKLKVVAFIVGVILWFSVGITYAIKDWTEELDLTINDTYVVVICGGCSGVIMSIMYYYNKIVDDETKHKVLIKRKQNVK